MIYRYKITANTVRGTMAVISAVPVRKALRFTPGQYASVGFRNGWRPSPMRCFSIIGGAEDGAIRFGVRISGPFTQALADLQPGDELLVRGPFGSFYMDQYDRRAVLIASGIGITPFLSMLQQPSTVPITLLYSNRSARDIPFYDELVASAQKRSNVQLGFFASDDIDANSPVIPGRISERYIRRVTTGVYASSTYFICGPSSFTQQMQSLLQSAGVAPDRVVCESFVQKTKGTYDVYGGIRNLTYGLTAATLAALMVGIMVLDLSQAVPKLASSQRASTTQTSQVTVTGPSTPASSGTTTSVASRSTPATSMQNSTPAPTTTTVTPTPAKTTMPAPSHYQPPVSSVS